MRYCAKVQEIINLAMFVSFGVAACIICIVLCGLTLLPSSTETLVYMVFYQMVMVSEIFMPAWLGTQLTYKNQELVFAAYNSDWIPRSEKFKRSLRLFVERANMPMVLTGYKMFPIALETFLSIMKFSYSCFTLVRTMDET
ncbi:7tm odorant receptor domain-containing protein [Phthorimaea operculella]|nr:7tm odorant receptor domain-containing protein [Phthorimaea operculella]